MIVEQRDATAEECEHGGTHFTFGYADEEDEEVIGTVLEEASVCNGADGDSPEVSVAFEDLDDAEDCPSGSGKKAVFSIDGVEATSHNICDGQAGAPGDDGRTIVMDTTELTANSDQCPDTGGFLYEFGYDDGEGNIDGEPLSTTHVCNGGDGEGGGGSNITVQEVATEHEDCNDEEGEVGPASVIEFRRGTTLLETAVVCYGTDGEQGPQGETGDQGVQGCSALITINSADDDEDGRTCRSIDTTSFSGEECDEESTTSTIVCDGLDGAEGPQGPAGDDGDDGAEGPQGPAGDDGDDGNPGCGDTISWEDLDVDHEVCVYGGKRVTIHRNHFNETAGECQEEEEDAEQFYICDGAGAVCQLTPFAKCSGVDFTDPEGPFAYMEGDFSNLNLRYADFSGANFELGDGGEVQLNDSDFTGANFEGANLSNANTINSSFHNARFEGANLAGAGTLTTSSTAGATYDADTTCPSTNMAVFEASLDAFTCATNDNLRACKLLPFGECIGFDLFDQHLEGDLNNIDLTDTTFTDSTFTGVDFTDATLERTDFSGTTLDDVDFINADVKGANFEGAELTDVDFWGATMSPSYKEDEEDGDEWFFTNFSNATINGMILGNSDDSANQLTLQNVMENEWLPKIAEVSFDGATIDHLDAEGIVALSISFRGAQIDEDGGSSTFADSILVAADFSSNSTTMLQGADFSGVKFYFDGSSADEEVDLDSDLDGASSFAGADLQGADFSGARIRHVDFSGAWLEGADFRSVTVSPNTPNSNTTSFFNADFGTGVDFGALDGGNPSNLRDTDFRNSTAEPATAGATTLNLAWAEFNRANFDGAVLPNVNMYRASANAGSGATSFFDAQLPGLDARGAKLYQADFGDADLTGAQFQSLAYGDGDDIEYVFTDLRGAYFDYANLTNAVLYYVRNGTTAATAIDFEEATLIGANLRGLPNFANFAGATWGDTTCPDFSNSDDHASMDCSANAASCRLLAQGVGEEPAVCDNGVLTGVNSDDPFFGLRDRNLTGIEFNNAFLSGANFSGSTLTGADFNGAPGRDADNANFIGAHLQGAFFEDIDLDGAHFQVDGTGNPSLRDAGFNRVSLISTNFNGANLRGATITNSEIDMVTVEGARLRDLTVTTSYLGNVVFDNANVYGASFTNSDLENVDFSMAFSSQFEGTTPPPSLTFVDFSGSTFLGDVDFSGLDISGGSWVTASFFVDSVELGGTEFGNISLMGMCGVGDGDITDTTFATGVTCPDGTEPEGETCEDKMIESCLLGPV